MRLDSPFPQLPLAFNDAVLEAEISTLPESAWRPHPEGHAGNSALPLIARGGDPTDGVAGAMVATEHLSRLPYLRQVLAALGAPLGRTRLMRLDGNAEATAHCDVNYYWDTHYRVHVPILTTPAMSFVCGDAQVNMAPGECWIFDTTRRHNVFNPEPTRRIHLVADTVGSAHLAELAACERDPQHATAQWTAPLIAFDPDADPALDLERENFPLVMTLWELVERVEAVLAALDDAAVAANLRQALPPVLADWRAQWARGGETEANRAGFVALRERAFAVLAPLRGRTQRELIDTVEWLEHAALFPTVANTNEPKKSTARQNLQRLQRPVFVVSPPRSGSTLLFETLAQAPGLATIGGESHRSIEGIPALAPAARGFESNRLTAMDAGNRIVALLHAGFAARMHERDGAPAPQRRLLEKTPKNALRVVFLAAAFPDAQFVYLYRDPRETIASMLDAWQSGRFVTYAKLPDWPVPPWSLLLTPSWRALAGRPLAEIVARQWAATADQALDDLSVLAPQRWCVASYDRLITAPQVEIERLCGFLDLDFDCTLSVPLPRSRYTLSSPDPDKWKRHADALREVLPYFEPAAQRARRVFAQPPAIRPPRRRASVDAPRDWLGVDFGSVYTESFPQLLNRLGASLLVSTYRGGRVVLVREHEGRLNTHLRCFANPRALAVGRHKLAIAAPVQVHEYRNQPAVADKLEPVRRHDACYLPQRAHTTGDIRAHEMVYVDGALWVANARFSCLCTLDETHSFVPRWRPRFISALAAEDCCHLNGMAMDAGRVRYASALGVSDSAQGWRARKRDGGVLIDVDSGELVSRDLSLPHLPRVHQGRFWLLASGCGQFCTLDLPTGRRDTVATLPGFARGLAFAGPYAFVGVSKQREKDGDALAGMLVRERICGIRVVDTRTGEATATLSFDGGVEQIYDVQLLPQRYPELAEPGDDINAHAFILPNAAHTETAVQT